MNESDWTNIGVVRQNTAKRWKGKMQELTKRNAQCWNKGKPTNYTLSHTLL